MSDAMATTTSRRTVSEAIQRSIRRCTPQPLIAFLVGGLTLELLLSAGGQGLLRTSEVPNHAWIVVLFVVAAVVAEQFPIHVRLNTKVQMTSVLVYLLAVLFSPAEAAVYAGIAMLIGELTVRKQKGNYPSDIATDVGRWMIGAFMGSETIRLVAPHLGSPAGFAAGAVVMWLVDMLSAPATLSPMSGEPPLSVIVASVREAGPAEGAQYVIGLLAAVLSQYQAWAILPLILPAACVYIATKRSKEMHEATHEMLQRMADTVDLRDSYTGGHSRRVTEYVEGILAKLEKEGPEVRLIVTAARLHDIGKIAVSDAVLNKPGKLTEAEWSEMAAHPEVGADFLRGHPGFSRGVDIVRHHHEAWDGSGYPHRLKATQIPFGARVIAVADSFDAMTSDRPYRKGMNVAKAVSILREGRGAQWDPQIVDAFVQSISERLEREENPRLRLVHAAEDVAVTIPA